MDIEEIGVFNEKVTRVRAALESAEQSLVLYLGLEDLGTVTLYDVTIAVFYSFNAFFKGEFVTMLTLKIDLESDPLFYLDPQHLNPLLKDAWVHYERYLATLENT